MANGFRFLFLFCSVLFGVASSAWAEVSRLSLLLTVSEQATLEINEEELDKIEEPNTRSFGFHYTMESGFGFGFSLSSFEVQSESTLSDCCTLSEELRYSSQFIDLSYRIGSDFNVTPGVGIFVGGNGSHKIRLDYNQAQEQLGAEDVSVSVDAENVHGTSWFLIFGVMISETELLIGYKATNVKYTFDFADKLSINDESKFKHRVQLGETMVGVGIPF